MIQNPDKNFRVKGFKRGGGGGGRKTGNQKHFFSLLDLPLKSNRSTTDKPHSDKEFQQQITRFFDNKT